MLYRSLPRHSAKVLAGWPQSDYEASLMISNKFTEAVHKHRRDKDYYRTRKLRLQFFSDFRKLRKSGVVGVLAYTEGLKFFGKLGMSARSQALLDTALEDHISPTTGMYLRVMQSYAHTSDLAGMTHTLKVSRNFTCSPGVAGRFIHFLAIGLHRGGYLKETFEIIASTWPIHLGSNTIYTTILQCSRSFEDSLLIIGDLEAEKRTIKMTEWGAFIDAPSTQGDIRSCLRIMETMRQQYKVVPSVIHLTSLLMSCMNVGDEVLFRKVFQIINDKGIELDVVARRMQLRFAELTGSDENTSKDNRGGIRLVEIRVGIQAMKGDFAAAEKEYHKRLLVLGTTKTWAVLESRLLSAALYDWMKLKGMSGSLLQYMLSKFNWLIHEKFGVNESIWMAVTTCSKLNFGYGSLLLYKTVAPLLEEQYDVKVRRLTIYSLLKLCDCLAVRVRHLMSLRDGWPPAEAVSAAREHFEALMKIYNAVFNNSPYHASKLLSPLILAHVALNLTESIVKIFRTLLLASHPSHMLEHASVFTEIFKIRQDEVAVSQINMLQEQQQEILTMTELVI